MANWKFSAGVVDACGAPFPRIYEKNLNDFYQGPGGKSKMIHEKNLKQKSRDTVPLIADSEIQKRQYTGEHLAERKIYYPPINGRGGDLSQINWILPSSCYDPPPLPPPASTTGLLTSNQISSHMD